ncbi:MAG: nucleotide sugar dehydrogenase [Candidatus Woesearchaeota archaeon]
MVAIIGLGYVGLPLALLSASKGIETIGFDISKEKVNDLKKGNLPFEDDIFKKWYVDGKDQLVLTDDIEDIKSENIKIICVPTPVNEDRTPNFEPLKKATEMVSNQLVENDLVVVESTVSPGTMEDVVKPILDKKNVNYFLAHCPERIDPGNKNYNVSNIPRNIGGIDSKSTSIAASFYRKILDTSVKELSTIKAAEATKIMENSFRDVNIAFINEMAKVFQAMGIDVLEVIEGAKTKPFGFLPHYPGIGVGGHCIAVDPYYLIKAAEKNGVNPKILKNSREVNKSMPKYALDILENQIRKQKIKNPKIAVLGISYKQDVKDDRESPYYDVKKELDNLEYDYNVYDPFFPEFSDYESLDEISNESNIILIVTAHSEFRDMEVPDNIEFVLDGRNILNSDYLEGKGIKYIGIGR